MYVIAMYNPDNNTLPDVYQEEDKVIYFKSEREAEYFLYDLYRENSINVRPLVEDNMILMGVQ